MLFNSFEFFLFFPIVTLLYFLLPLRGRWWWLVVASCVFYMALIPKYILVLFAAILIDYWAGLRIEDARSKREAKFYLVLSIVSTCGLLFFFKYHDFFVENVNAALNYFGMGSSLPLFRLILPVGLSFHTFQSLSYVIEVYRGNQKAERSLLVYSLYVLYFPQLVAGPIERPQNVLPQLYVKHPFDVDRARSGLLLMALGFFRKCVVADRISPLVDAVYNDPSRYSGPSFVAATVLFAFQIYCDFAGYSDIARGASRILGIELMVNFRNPYASVSVTEFWRRWHISLSTWFRDYLYYPLGGNRASFGRWQTNLMITFLVSGLWHGANWTFVIWGGLNGLFLVWENILKTKFGFAWAVPAKMMPAWRAWLQRIVVFVQICLTWVFFRAANVGDAWRILKGMGRGWNASAFEALWNSPNYYSLRMRFGKFFDGEEPVSLALGVVMIAVLVAFESRRGDFTRRLMTAGPGARWSVYLLLFGVLLAFSSYRVQKFIYFQF